ncbi:MAG: hypothetical protein SFU56_17000 [Capsulimonadales bacterium]|nr:hypothetical protein [Capsulimonadales bacterium]
MRERHLEEITDDELLALAEDLVENLLLEHLTGRHEGCLNAAAQFVEYYRQTRGETNEEEMAEAAAEEGFTPEEIAAVLQRAVASSEPPETDDTHPTWSDYAGSSPW